MERVSPISRRRTSPSTTPSRDESPTRPPLRTLVIVTAPDLYHSIRVFLNDDIIPDEVECALLKKQRPVINIEDDLSNSNSIKFTPQEKSCILGFLKAIGFVPQTFEYDSSIPSYPKVQKAAKSQGMTQLANTSFEMKTQVNRIWSFSSEGLYTGRFLPCELKAFGEFLTSVNPITRFERNAWMEKYGPKLSAPVSFPGVVWAYNDEGKLAFGELWLEKIHLENGRYIGSAERIRFPASMVEDVISWDVWCMLEDDVLFAKTKKPSEADRIRKVPFLFRTKTDIYKVWVHPLVSHSATEYRFASQSNFKVLMEGLCMGHVDALHNPNGYSIPESEIEEYTEHLQTYLDTRIRHQRKDSNEESVLLVRYDYHSNPNRGNEDTHDQWFAQIIGQTGSMYHVRWLQQSPNGRSYRPTNKYDIHKSTVVRHVNMIRSGQLFLPIE